jgi:tetratricopeptide (TPR) repeat protein
MAAIVAENALGAASDADQWLYLALCEHDPVMADRALAAIKPSESINGSGGPRPHAWFEGLVARARGDAAKARAAFASARVEVEATVRAQPDYGPNLSILGMIDAALGRKEDAIREGRQAIELLPVNKNAMEGAGLMENLGIIYAWTGEKDLAIEQIAATLNIPSPLNYGHLHLHPCRDPLRGDPRFEKVVTDLAPPASSGR